MRLTRIAPLALVLIAASALPGCNLFRSKSVGPLIAAPSSPIADVPVPAGFVMTEDSTSKVVPGNSIRFVDHRYKGAEDVLPVVKFYRDTLPEKGWNWIDQAQARGNEVTLHYTKANEVLYVTITPSGFPSYKTTIRIKIDPVGRDVQQTQ